MAECPAGRPLGEESPLRLRPTKETAAAAEEEEEEEETERIGKESVIVMEMIGTPPAPGARQSDRPNVRSCFWDGGNKRVWVPK